MFLTNLFKRGNNSLKDTLTTPLSPQQLLLTLSLQTFKRAESKLGQKLASLGQPQEQNTKEELLKYITDLYNMLLISLGPDIARNTFEITLTSFKNYFGLSNSYFELLKMLPIPVMESEKIALLSRQELENELRLHIRELENIKLNLEKTVANRTEEIAAERNKMAIILAGIGDAVIAVDLQRQIIRFNKAAQTLTGFSEIEVLGKPIGQIIKLYDADDELLEPVFCPIKTDEYEGVNFQKNGLRLTGKNQQSYINLITSQIKEGVHINLGAILSLHDITQEQELEMIKLDFVSMAAHELRTPLTAAKGYISVLLSEETSNLTPEQLRFLQRIQISTDQLISLVENLLSVSRIEKGILTINLQPTNWEEMVTHSVEEMQEKARGKKLELVFDKPPFPLPHVLVDKLRIVEVLTNLLSNAIAYTNPSGKITVWVEAKDNLVITHIQDTGLGIPQEAIPHLFSKFFRVSGNLEQGSQGTGLGLYISKAILNLHQGKIWVESQLGHGSTFSFSLLSTPN